jgi:hypothetical protein
MWIDGLKACRKGAVVYVIAASLPLVLGGLAFAVDMSVYQAAHNRLQTTADAAALAALTAVVEGRDGAAAALEVAQTNLPDGYGTALTAADVTLGHYDNARGFVPDDGSEVVNAVRVIAVRNAQRGNAVPQFFSGLFGVAEPNIGVEAVAARPSNVFYEPPESVVLDSEAGDFNEIYAYCYDPNGGGSRESRRSQMVLIANNMPSGQNIVTISGGRIAANPAAQPQWPNCSAEGLTLSFRLRNIRHAKSHPTLWNNPNAQIDGRRPGRPEHNHYTDTVLENGVERFNFNPSLVETVMCDSRDECDPSKPGNTIPKGKNRFPQLATEGCQPGRFMYFGWEDRPTGVSGAKASWLDPAWTDSDFDDIAIIMKCPASGRLGDGLVRLVR